MNDSTNDSQAAILSMVPPIFHKYLTPKSRNQSYGKSVYVVSSVRVSLKLTAIS